MPTDYKIKFLKQGWGLTDNTPNVVAASTLNPYAICFDTTTKQIYVGGVAYGGAISDANYANGVLTITKSNGTTQTLDFNDVASAEATLAVFAHMNELIGVATVGSNTTLNYSGTNYLGTGIDNLVDADKELDTQIRSINDRIGTMDATNVQGVTSTDTDNVIELTLNGITQTDGLISQGTGTGKVTFAKVAKTGKAVDVAVDDSHSVFTGTNVEDVLYEISSKIDNTNVTIDGQVGQFTTDQESMIAINSGARVIGVRLNANGYITKDSNGLDLTRVDSNGTSTTASDLATVKTVTEHIEALDVDPYTQAELTDTNTSFTVYGIKEVDGKIGSDTATAGKIVFESTYNASTNKIALQSTVKNAVEALDVTTPVQPVIVSTTNDVIVLTMKGVEEEDGIIKQGGGTDTLTFAKVAKTGKAQDISFTTGDYVESNLEQAVNDMDDRIESLEALPKYDVIVVGTNALPDAGEATMHKIYLKSEPGQADNDIYGEYITVRSGSAGSYTYTWEKLGTTKADLTGYVKTVIVNGKKYTVGTDSTELNLGDKITSITDGDNAITTEAGFTTDYIDTEVTVVSTKDATDGTYAAQVTSAAKVKIQAVGTADGSHKGLAEASDVKEYISSVVENLDKASTTTTGTNVSVTYKEEDGIVTISSVTVDYATVTVDTTNEPTLTVQNGSRLVVGSDISKVKEYVDAKISTMVNALDADVTSDDLAVAKVEVVETDGKITDVVVTTLGAGVQYTASTSNTEAGLTVSTSTGALTGGDVATIKSYVDDRTNVVDTLSTVVVNEGQTQIATVGGHPINTAVSLVWDVYEEPQQ